MAPATLRKTHRVAGVGPGCCGSAHRRQPVCEGSHRPGARGAATLFDAFSGARAQPSGGRLGLGRVGARLLRSSVGRACSATGARCRPRSPPPLASAIYGRGLDELVFVGERKGGVLRNRIARRSWFNDAVMEAKPPAASIRMSCGTRPQAWPSMQAQTSKPFSGCWTRVGGDDLGRTATCFPMTWMPWPPRPTRPSLGTHQGRLTSEPASDERQRG